jgi:hypothetical protein
MSLTLTSDEVLSLTGGLTQPRRQVEELQRQGFWRARLTRDRRVVLERAHYEAVCAGALPPAAFPADTGRPQLRSVLKAA